METAIRWSSKSNASEQRILLVDVVGRSFKIGRISSYKNSRISYDVISSHTKVPAFRAFDWCPSNEALVAVGQPSGEATVLRIDEGSQDTISLPIRNQRYCNAVAFNTEGLLAAGLDKVRNDFCLNVWDLNQRISATSPRGPGPERQTTEPIRKLASSEPITSVKFFSDRPDQLVAGVKAQFVRIYDLREQPGHPALQFPTRCVHNLAVDPLDQNYIASCFPGADATVCIWDRRSSSRSLSSGGLTSITPSDSSQFGAALEFRNVVDTAHSIVPASIWSLRFSRSRRGCLGVLSSNGQFRVYEVAKTYVSEEEHSRLNQTLGDGSAEKYPEQIYTKSIRDLHASASHPSRGRKENERAVSFDWMGIDGKSTKPLAIALSPDGNIPILELQPPPPRFALSSRADLVNGRRSSNLEPTLISPSIKAQNTISGTLQALRRSIKPEIRSNDASSQTNEDPKETWFDHESYSSRRRHEHLLFMGKFRLKLDVQDALTSMTTPRRRCEEGYRLDCYKNKEIVSDDPWLQDMWAWIGRSHATAVHGAMVHKNLDLSYLGVYAIWSNNLGKNAKLRRIGYNASQNIDVMTSVKGLVQGLELSLNKSCKTGFQEHRLLCLHICGAKTAFEDLEIQVKQLVQDGEHTKAAALAVIQDEPKLAFKALRNGKSTQAHKMLAMAIAGAAKGDTDEDWEETCEELAKELTDPYARAILALVSKGSWHSVIEETSLPLKYRVEVALRWLEDDQLTTYLRVVTRDAIRNGDIEGLVLTGLTHLAMDLFQNYIEKFNDLQTAVLAMSYTVPRFVKDPRFFTWRETYRHHMNSWGMKEERVRFDIKSSKLAVAWDGKKLIKPPLQQISLTCNFCNKPLNADDDDNDPNPFGEIATDVLPPQTGPSTATGTVCPKCKRHMPRCGICSMWLGTPDPASKGGRQMETRDVTARFVAFCMSCNHGFHANHARDWFARHAICPIPECNCTCDM